MDLAVILALILSVASLSFAEHDNGTPHHHHHHDHKDLDSEYSFKRILVKDSYTLHWSFDVDQETISFAINVSTDGWVGFGLSPNGGMAHSDVVIGWIKDGNTYLEDRYATTEALPEKDESQDWILEGGMAVDGWTILQFSRKWVTCDEKDRNIEAVTARVIYSWHTEDPDSQGSFLQHTERGSASINFLGGLQDQPDDPEDLKHFTVAALNVDVPHVDTTYWCHKYRLPDEVLQTQKYVTRYATSITDGSDNVVHHMLIYLCPPESAIESTHGLSGDCEKKGTAIFTETMKCRAGVLIAAWAVGGEDFVYPEDVAYPIGGEGNSQYLLLEVHYDNPKNISGIRDSSGVKFFYTSKERKHDAAISTIGRQITPSMMIPPNAQEFVVTAECSSQCTEKFLPEGGITIFANFLHTHLIGKAAVLQHFRRTAGCNNSYAEMKPIENNPTYDFDYQQTNFLPEAIKVMPGDVLSLKCIYNSAKSGSKRTGITVGGFATKEEMCLTFPIYYPATKIGICGSTLFQWSTVFTTFAGKHALGTVFQENSTAADLEEAFGNLSWDKDEVDSFQEATSTAQQAKFCTDSKLGTAARDAGSLSAHVTPKCFYSAPEECIISHGDQPENHCTFLTAVIVSYFIYNILAFMNFCGSF